MPAIHLGSAILHVAGRPAPPEFYERYGPCCFESANTDGDSCNCWIPILFPEHERHTDGRPVIEEGPNELHRKACHDCAYRQGSPEREATGYMPTNLADNRFYCHQAAGSDNPLDESRMPRVTVWVHSPSGTTEVVEADDYKPIMRGDRAWLADGSPAPLCAGWAVMNRVRTPRPTKETA